MQVTETNNDGLKREFKVVIAAKDIDEKLDVRLRQIGETVRIPGFRPGKVPSAVLKKRFGQSVMGEVVEESVSNSADQAMMERGMRPALQPKIEITSYEEGKDLEYTMAVELIPDFEPGELSKLELERLSVKIDDSQIDEALERIALQHKRSEPIAEARKSKSGDVVVIDFKGSVGGEEFPGGSAEDHHLELGSNAFIAGFEEQLTDVGVGEHASVNVTFPAEYANNELAGKEAVFEVDVKEIREPVAAPIDDELAKMAGLESLDELRASVRDSIANEYQSLSRTRLKRGLLDALAEAHDFEVPEGMVDLEFESIWKQVEERREQDQAPDDDKEKSDEELKADYRAIAVRRVRLGLILSEIGRRNNVDVANEDVTRAIMAEAQQYPGREQEVLEFYRKNVEAMANLRAPLFEEKVIDFVVDGATVTEREVSIGELMALLDEDMATENSSGGKGVKAKAGAKKGAKKVAKKGAKKATRKSSDKPDKK
jgi:trigger factor